MAEIAKENVEILIHIGAPSRASDDARYRALAEAYLEFEPITRQNLKSAVFTESAESMREPGSSQLPIQTQSSQGERDSQASWHPDEEEEEEEEVITVSQLSVVPESGSESVDRLGVLRAIHSPQLSFNSAVDSPIFRVPNQRMIEESPALPRHNNYRSQSWEEPGSVVPDSQPENETSLVAFSSPTRVLELYLEQIARGEREHPAAPAQGQDKLADLPASEPVIPGTQSPSIDASEMPSSPPVVMNSKKQDEGKFFLESEIERSVTQPSSGQTSGLLSSPLAIKSTNQCVNKTPLPASEPEVPDGIEGSIPGTQTPSLDLSSEAPHLPSYSLDAKSIKKHHNETPLEASVPQIPDPEVSVIVTQIPSVDLPSESPRLPSNLLNVNRDKQRDDERPLPASGGETPGMETPSIVTVELLSSPPIIGFMLHQADTRAALEPDAYVAETSSIQKSIETPALPTYSWVNKSAMIRGVVPGSEGRILGIYNSPIEQPELPSSPRGTKHANHLEKVRASRISKTVIPETDTPSLNTPNLPSFPPASGVPKQLGVGNFRLDSERVIPETPWIDAPKVRPMKSKEGRPWTSSDADTPSTSFFSNDSTVLRSSPLAGKTTRGQSAPPDQPRIQKLLGPGATKPLLKRKWQETSIVEETPMTSYKPPPALPSTPTPSAHLPSQKRQKTKSTEAAFPTITITSSKSSSAPTSSAESLAPTSKWTNLLEIHPSPPATSSSTLSPSSLITPSLHLLTTVLPLPQYFIPISQTRELRPMERGYWSIPTKTWSEGLRMRAWKYLGEFVGGDRAGWGVWCVRDEGWEEVRIYCWGVVVGHVWLQVFVASERKVVGMGARWVGGDGKAVVVMSGGS